MGCVRAFAILRTAGLSAVLLVACGPAGQDRCENVVCDQPPADACKDENTLLRYSLPGSCKPETGDCEYHRTEVPCEQGCSQGRCQGEQMVEGWISVFEINDAVGQGSGVQAYFSVELHFRRSLPHQIARFTKLTKEVGPCALYEESTSGEALRMDPCMGACNEDQECVWDNGQNVCRPLPEHFDVGSIELQGLKASVSMAAGQYDRYAASGLPADLFDQGAEVQAKASGGELSPFSLKATGVAHLEISQSQVELVKDQSITISWTPTSPVDSEVRVQVLLQVGIHWPSVPVALMCDVADSAGKVEIDAELVNMLRERTFVIQQFSRIMRYTRSTISPFGKEIELVVGSVRGLELIVQ